MHRIVFVLSLILLLSVGLFAQSQPACNVNSTNTLVHAEGLAERLGDLTIACTGGTASAPASLNVFITLNTNITNRVDADGVPQGITVNGATSGPARINGTTLNLTSLNYSIPATPATPVVITVSGIRAAIAPIITAGGVPATVTYSVLGVGAQFASTGTLTAAIASRTLLSSFINNGVPCSGSPLPATFDFASFAAGTTSSTLRVTEASAGAFTPKDAGADSGLRILVGITGYGTGARVFVPDAIAGNSALTPTTTGAFASTPGPGSYTPGANQLLMIRVNGANSSGAGGTLVMNTPVTTANFGSVSELTVTNGAAFAVYEVVDSNPAVQESAQIPVFVSANAVNCPTTLTPALTVQIAPVSSVTTATQTDPVPRFVPTMPATDCTVLGDCNASYFPALFVDTTPLSFTGSSKGAPQNAYIRVGNSGSGIVTFSTSVTYPSGTPSGWLGVTPPTGSNNISLNVVASPANLDPGTYTATVNVNAGSFGSFAVPVTFTVGAVGVTVQAVGNAASFVYDAVTAGSYAVIYGLNMGGTNVSVTFNGVAATVIYKSATQINAIVPSNLGAQQGAAVVVTADGKASNSFPVTLAPNSLGIFTPGIVNVETGDVNSSSSPAARGSFVSVYLTGLTIPVTGQVTVNIGTQLGIVPSFAGAQPTLPALDQVNVVIPSGLPLTPNPVKLAVCIPNSLGQQNCSNQVDLYVK